MAPFDLSYWHATTKTYASFGVFGFFRRKKNRQKNDPSMVKSHFKNTIGNSFFEVPLLRQNAPIFFRIVIIYDSVQN